MKFHPSFLAGLITLLTTLLLTSAEPPVPAEPLVLGKGGERFRVGKMIHQDDFDTLAQWVMQIEEKEGFPPPKVEARDGVLDCLLAGRGATIWFRKKLRTRLAISYEVLCPEASSTIEGIEVRDLNQFWMASDPQNPYQGLFDSEKYDGNFGSYHKMRGYYASTAGRGNTTTRMRRYPRTKEGKPTTHLALTGRDRQEDFLITPDHTMKVQLVAFDDLVQYIVDGKLVYEMAFGDLVPTAIDGREEREGRIKTYLKREFPFYREGYFGFRLVKSHHRYSNFRIHELEEIPAPEPVKVEVASLAELRKAAKRSHQVVTMKPGKYVVEKVTPGLPAFRFTGSHNSFDLTGVTIEMPIARLSEIAGSGRNRVRTYVLSGNDITLKGGTFINTYPRPMDRKIDFGAYNQNSDFYPKRTVTEMQVNGDDVRLTDCRMIVRGSSPYGYGNMYGIGGGAAIPLRKHCGILLHGDRAVVDGCQVKMEAFGHAIFVQHGDEVLVKNCRVEGELRPSNDFLQENDEGDLARKFEHRIQWPDSVKGLKVPKDHMINLAEDGIRAYKGAGRITVEHCEVVRMRGGIKLYMARAATVRHCEVRDCVIQGFSVPRRGVIENCRGNAAYGPLLYVHSDSHHDQKIEIEVLPAPHGIGDHPLAAIKGKAHEITFTSEDNTGAQLKRPIIVGYPMRFDYLSWDYPAVPVGMEKYLEKFGPDRYTAERITLRNETPTRSFSATRPKRTGS